MKLRWYIDGNIARTKTYVGGGHILDANYRPVKVNLMARVAGEGTDNTVIDINDDGESIFDARPALPNEMTEKTWVTIPNQKMLKGSLVTLDIDQISSQDTCRDLTVELELEEA